ncbi:MAG: HAD-IC family P-type ATPase [Bacteroidia bacterium]|nr:HAD-IC family P-type ATPase [Bacteroidia bacterium]MDW8014846.1 HAD-IC family P-type ATPase [Bacteroidia bacterium]
MWHLPFAPHAASVEEVASTLHTTPQGLSSHEAERRLKQVGPNHIQKAPSISLWKILWHQFSSPFIYLLIAAVGISLLLGDYVDAIVIAAVLILNAIIGFIQEYNAERAVEALRSMTAPQATVLRNGVEQRIPAAHLVPGDVVLLESGVRVPADIRLSETILLQVDESLLTGESNPVYKDPSILPADTLLADRKNMVYAGTIITSGRGRGYVVATGALTELGRIAESLSQTERGRIPLLERMERLAKIIGIFILSGIALIFSLGLLFGYSLVEMFKVGVGVAVAAIPEGLPIVLTVTLGRRVWAMARRNALVRRLAAIETIGRATVIGSDKTGTLTENRMTVQVFWTDGTKWKPNPLNKGEIDALQSLALEISILSNEAELADERYRESGSGDPTDLALLWAAVEAGYSPKALRAAQPEALRIPFEPELRYSASFRQKSESGYTLYVKGAPEKVISLCSHRLTREGPVPIDSSFILEAVASLAQEGMRVLGLAYKPELSALPSPPFLLSDLIFVGLVGLMDPPRAGVPQAVADCHAAGIRVLMITGDHAATAQAIAAQIGIFTPEVITGEILQQLSPEQLEEKIEKVNVYARVSPQQKLEIVRLLQKKGEIVAVTGDGVNDAPALKAAHVGISMGKEGTDVAREASDIILADDNFVTIRNAVEEGRIAFQNIRNATFFLLSTGAASIILFLIAILLGWPMPILPAQLLWLNLVTNGLQDVAMAFEPALPGLMRQKPRPPNEGIISPVLWERTLLVALLMAGVIAYLFWYEYHLTGDLAKAQTVALTTFVLFQNFHIGNARSEYLSAFRLSPFRNPFLMGAAITALGIHAAALYLPPTQFVLRVVPIEWEAWLRSILFALSVIGVGEAHKWIRSAQRAWHG